MMGVLSSIILPLIYRLFGQLYYAVREKDLYFLASRKAKNDGLLIFGKSLSFAMKT